MDRDLIGYTTANGTTTSFTCPDGFPFRTGYTFPGDLKEYAHCDGFTSSTFRYRGYRVATECVGSSFLFTHWIVQGSSSMGYSGAWGWFYNSGSGAGRQWLISCHELMEFPKGFSTVFLESPRTWEPTSVESTTQSETSATETEDNLTTESEASSTSTPKTASRPSKAAETESPTPTEVGSTNNKPSAGVIAGAVVGSLVGLAIIIGCLILAFRMGKKGRKGKWLPRLTIAWPPRETKEPVSTIYPIVTSIDQPGLIPTMEDRDPNLPPTYIYGSNRTELATQSDVAELPSTQSR
ncbi:uncharacterized protein B0J16DRAFT_317541 [Fusarium flagelliforme]|uniref:uncharacterized protein n=1 Tax=Fusarium flagelliforme TaxID=2675880 RepID=UPI001E8D560C|nr:uncharacterized protein B0J16DRAFT_317541 [Fusarium flagelliforme]KAH7193887.1 hypothetical protein B0J16DRAFT_317541 [Fusarium flagelliforme]